MGVVRGFFVFLVGFFLFCGGFVLIFFFFFFCSSVWWCGYAGVKCLRLYRVPRTGTLSIRAALFLYLATPLRPQFVPCQPFKPVFAFPRLVFSFLLRRQFFLELTAQPLPPSPYRGPPCLPSYTLSLTCFPAPSSPRRVHSSPCCPDPSSFLCPHSEVVTLYLRAIVMVLESQHRSGTMRYFSPFHLGLFITFAPPQMPPGVQPRHPFRRTTHMIVTFSCRYPLFLSVLLEPYSLPQRC